jgi:hypothetical protein
MVKYTRKASNKGVNEKKKKNIEENAKMNCKNGGRKIGKENKDERQTDR